MNKLHARWFYKCMYMYVHRHRHRAGRLTWHDVIPSDEVWIKLGGDKGGLIRD